MKHEGTLSRCGCRAGLGSSAQGVRVVGEEALVRHAHRDVRVDAGCEHGEGGREQCKLFLLLPLWELLSTGRVSRCLPSRTLSTGFRYTEIPFPARLSQIWVLMPCLPSPSSPLLQAFASNYHYAIIRSSVQYSCGLVRWHSLCRS